MRLLGWNRKMEHCNCWTVNRPSWFGTLLEELAEVKPGLLIKRGAGSNCAHAAFHGKPSTHEQTPKAIEGVNISGSEGRKKWIYHAHVQRSPRPAGLHTCLCVGDPRVPLEKEGVELLTEVAIVHLFCRNRKNSRVAVDARGTSGLLGCRNHFRFTNMLNTWEVLVVLRPGERLLLAEGCSERPIPCSIGRRVHGCALVAQDDLRISVEPLRQSYCFETLELVNPKFAEAEAEMVDV